MTFEETASLFAVVIFIMIFDTHRQLLLLFLIMCAAALGTDGIAAGLFYWVILRPLTIAVEIIGGWYQGRIRNSK